MWKSSLLLSFFAVFLFACSPAAANPEPTPTSLPPTAVPPTITPLPEPTATAVLPPTSVPTFTPLPLRTFEIDSEQSIARYRVEEEFLSGAVTALGKELGFFTAEGWTQAVAGQFQLSQTPNGGLNLDSGQITVEINTLRSDERRRDQRIREQHLESNKYPLAEFTITGVTGFPETYEEGEAVTFFLTGDMTIREVTNSETFTVTARLENDTISGSGVTEIYMVDYGFDPPEIAGYLVAQDPATIEIELVAVESD